MVYGNTNVSQEIFLTNSSIKLNFMQPKFLICSYISESQNPLETKMYTTYLFYGHRWCAGQLQVFRLDKEIIRELG